MQMIQLIIATLQYILFFHKSDDSSLVKKDLDSILKKISEQPSLEGLVQCFRDQFQLTKGD